MSVRENHGMQCPKCGKDTGLVITATRIIDAQIYDDGTDDKGGDTTWNSGSGARCSECGWEGCVADMTDAYYKAEDMPLHSFRQITMQFDVYVPREVSNDTAKMLLASALRIGCSEFIRNGGNGDKDRKALSNMSVQKLELA